ncbi:MAG: hypothetical protein Q9224_003754 [Gallowayella concinna]
MSWFSILPTHLTIVETWLIRFFLLLGLLTIGPWALLIVYDLLLWLFRSILYVVPYVGGRARGKKKPRVPSLSERPSGRARTFSIGGTQFAGIEDSERDRLKERIPDSTLTDVSGPGNGYEKD